MANKTNDGTDRPLHIRIRGDIEQRIMSGALKPGDRIPFEHELMVDYGCSRMTVSKAISALAQAGLILRRRRAGSFVAPQRIDMAALAIPDMRTEVEGRGARYRIELLSRKILRKADGTAPEIIVPKGTMLLALACRHWADEKPFAVEQRLINLTAVPAASEIDFGVIAPGSWLLENVPWTEAENRIFARLAGDDAPHLEIAPDAPCLGLERQTWRSNQLVTHVRQSFPATGFNLVARFTAG